MGTVRTGLEALTARPEKWLKGERLGLLCNPASVDSKYTHARMLIGDASQNNLVALFSPQHGFFAEKQDNMIESTDVLDPVLHIPVYSLYGDTRIPTEEMFETIDALIIDIQDVGTRVYTFMSTMAYCMETAKTLSKRIIVLDRPNPVGGEAVEGNCLVPDCASFVGRFGLPMRHGLTFGELSLLFNDAFGIGCDLTVVPMDGWQRAMYFADTHLPWVAPSPNLPTPVSTVVYPGQVLLEGTNCSEGRGTTQPFEFFGAPFIDPQDVLDALPMSATPGMILRPIVFEPTSNKWSGHSCNGFQIHVTDPTAYRPYRLALELIQAALRLYPDDFEWKQPPYEYEYQRMPIDLLIGDRDLRRRLERFEPIARMEESWHESLAAFITVSRAYHLYD